MYEFFDHTGDMGITVEADDAEGAYTELAMAFLDLVTGSPDSVEPEDERPLHVEGVDAADLAVALLNELLFLFDTEGFLCARLLVEELDEGSLDAIAVGESFDPRRHPIARPVKAATHHHALFVEDEDGPVRARIIVDL